jgi:hypothetical protein
MLTYLEDTQTYESWDGAAWVAFGGGGSATSNLVINGAFEINQRVYVSAANLASGDSGFDRWKSNFTNTTLSFTAAPQGQEVTINTSGGLQQIIERANITAGEYTLSFSGTAEGRIYNFGATPPAYAASPITATLDGLQDVVVEFTSDGSSKTLGFVKLEKGSTATSFTRHGDSVQSELAACQRYYEKSNNIDIAPGQLNSLGNGFIGNVTQTLSSGVAGNVAGINAVPFKVTKRAAPTMRVYDYDGTIDAVRVYPPDAKKTGVTGLANIQMSGSFQFMSFSATSQAISTANNLLFHWTADAEL